MALNLSDPQVFGSAVGAGASLLSTGGNVLSTVLANQANMRLAKYSYEQQKQMIREQNEYNSPRAQLERYVEAGLNPNLIYGEGSASAGNQSAIAKYDAPTIQAPRVSPSEDLARFAQIAMQAQMNKADLDIKHQQFENLKEQQFQIRAQRHAQDIQNKWNSILYGFDPGLVNQSGDDQKVMESLGFRKYKADLLSQESLKDLRDAQKSYTQAQERVSTLTAEQKEYYNKNMQPLMKEILEKRSEGIDYQNDLLELQKRFFVADKIFYYSKGALDSIANFIKKLIPGVNIGGSGNATPQVPSTQVQPYNPGATWGSWPDQNLAPGL